MRIPLNTQSLLDVLADSLRARILSEEIPAGRAITELGVASEYEVARQTAKGAIEKLITEGLLERSMNRSAQVPQFTEPIVNELYEARGIIESSVYQNLAERSLVTAEVHAAHDTFSAAVRGGDLIAVVDGDINFHRALVASLGNSRLSRTHGFIINEMRLCLAQVQSHSLLDPQIIEREHALILEKIQEGAVTEARIAGIAHLNSAREKLLPYLREQSTKGGHRG